MSFDWRWDSWSVEESLEVSMPGERTKNGVVHVVPLSAAARDLLRGLLPGNSTEVKRITSDALVLPGAANFRPPDIADFRD